MCGSFVADMVSALLILDIFSRRRAAPAAPKQASSHDCKSTFGATGGSEPIHSLPNLSGAGVVSCETCMKLTAGGGGADATAPAALLLLLLLLVAARGAKNGCAGALAALSAAAARAASMAASLSAALASSSFFCLALFCAGVRKNVCVVVALLLLVVVVVVVVLVGIAICCVLSCVSLRLFSAAFCLRARSFFCAGVRKKSAHDAGCTTESTDGRCVIMSSPAPSSGT